MIGSSGACLKNNETDSSRLNLSFDRWDTGIANLTVAEATLNLLQVISMMRLVVSIKKDSSTKLFAEFVNDLKMEPAPLSPAAVTYISMEEGTNSNQCKRWVHSFIHSFI
jgi:hypothetical protein